MYDLIRAGLIDDGRNEKGDDDDDDDDEEEEEEEDGGGGAILRFPLAVSLVWSGDGLG
jgi:hypothetical protein